MEHNYLEIILKLTAAEIERLNDEALLRKMENEALRQENLALKQKNRALEQENEALLSKTGAHAPSLEGMS